MFRNNNEEGYEWLTLFRASAKKECADFIEMESKLKLIDQLSPSDPNASTQMPRTFSFSAAGSQAGIENKSDELSSNRTLTTINIGGNEEIANVNLKTDNEELEDIYETIYQEVVEKEDDSSQEENENEKEKDTGAIALSREEEEDFFLTKPSAEANLQQERNNVIDISSRYLKRLSILSYHMNPVVDNKELAISPEETRVIPDSAQVTRILRSGFSRGRGCG